MAGFVRGKRILITRYVWMLLLGQTKIKEFIALVYRYKYPDRLTVVPGFYEIYN